MSERSDILPRNLHKRTEKNYGSMKFKNRNFFLLFSFIVFSFFYFSFSAFFPLFLSFLFLLSSSYFTLSFPFVLSFLILPFCSTLFPPLFLFLNSSFPVFIVFSAFLFRLQFSFLLRFFLFKPKSQRIMCISFLIIF